MTSEVKEGFLCPICMADLGDGVQLQVHFEERHDKEDPAFIQNIKDLFGKAKKKVLNESAPSDEDGVVALASSLGQELARQTVFGSAAAEPGDYDPVSGIHRHLLEQPDPVRPLLHTDFFRAERKKRLDRNKATNQVLIRLERLMSNLPSDPVKRRAHEQDVVPWVDEDLVKLCPSCARSFNLARRKHHCRLCGGVVCDDCSTGVSFEFARRVVSPASIAGFEAEPARPSAEAAAAASKKTTLAGLVDDGINSTIMNIVDPSASTQFRSCRLCRQILERQEARVGSAAKEEPVIVRMFETLQAQMREGAAMSRDYVAMTESLRRGEEDHTPEAAQLARVKLLKVADNVDVISKRIAALEPTSNQPLERTLQQRIRTAAVTFIKETLVALPTVPSEDEFEALKRQRVAEAERRVAEEREAARLARQRLQEQKQQEETLRKMGLDRVASMATGSRLNNSGLALAASPRPKQSDGVVLGQGLVLTSAPDSFTSSEDPMVQQIKNLQGFIAEARRLKRFDEVRALEANLSELQEEFRRAQREKRELEENYQNFKQVFHKRSPMDDDDEIGASNDALSSTREVNVDGEPDEYDASGKNPFF